MTITERITAGAVARGVLPARLTGVRWVDTDWTECRAHLLDASWSFVIADDDPAEGEILTGAVDCDACRERRLEEATITERITELEGQLAELRVQRDREVLAHLEAGRSLREAGRLVGLSPTGAKNALERARR